MKYGLLSLFLTLTIIGLSGQNNPELVAFQPRVPNPEFFKYVPLIDEQTPDWARLMYSENPNVFAVERAFEAYYETTAFEKSIHTQNYKHWLRALYQNHYVGSLGFINIPTEAEIEQELANYLNQRAQESANAGSWLGLGPYETQAPGGGDIVTWQANVYTIDQSIDNPNIVYAGTETGGIFKSTDKGLNWVSIGDDLVLGGIGSVKTDPNNANVVYVGQGSRLYKSTNGGQAWTEMLNIGGLNLRDIHINPNNSNLVLLASALGLYRSVDGGQNFNQILSDGCYDIEMKPDDFSVYYVSKVNSALNLTEVWKSTDAGLTFTAKTAGWFVPTNATAASNGGARLAVSPADPDYLYCALLGTDVSYSIDNNWIGVYKSTDAGESWTLPAGEPGGPYTNTHWCLSSFHPTFSWGGNYDQGFYNLGIAVSSTDPESFLVGCLNLFRSEDGGASYTQWGGYGGGPGWQHPDIQEIEINGSDVWVASDGGLNLYSSDWNTLSSRMKGINSSEYWGFDAGWNEDVLVGGRYHNGNGGYHENYPAGKFLRLGGAESPTGYVNAGNNRQVHHSDIGGDILPTSINGAVENTFNLGLYPNEAVANENKSEIVTDPRCYNHLYMGVGNSLYKSEDGGVSFTVVQSFNNSQNRVTGIEISRNNPEVIYVAQRLSGAATIWKSEDGGQNWTNLSPSFSGFGGGGIFMSVDQDNENNIWVALSNGGSSGNKVFRSTNGGQSWTNLTTSALNGHWPEDVLMQSGTNGGIYLATNLSIFYRNNSHGNWQSFSDGAPAKMANMTLKPFYRDGKIRSATYNRGIWESTFFEPSSVIAQPMVDKLSSDCARDIFYFDDYSILNHSNASWNWSFSPTPASVSSVNARNPEVVFGAAGTYTATLTVSRNGSIDTKSITVTVNEGCDAERVPGNALVLGGGSSDYVVSSPLNVSTNSFTISMWIKRDGDQTDWAGLFFQRGASTVGLNFGTNNELRYHPGWPWNSGLTVPDNEWTHVALVITPSSATIYRNGIGATHNVSQPVFNLTSSTYLGADPNFSNRRFNGLIDEVSFYNRAMSQDEIRELMHLTRDPSSEPNLLYYYQFNEVDGPVLDRSGTKHGTLSGGAARLTSTGPFGGGVQQTFNVSSGGVYNFSDINLEMEFPSTGSYPNGDLVAFKIENAPDQLAGDNPVPTEGYWIVNNYGTNTSFAALDRIEFSGLSNISGNGTDHILFKRPSNADGNSWGLGLSAATAATPTSLTFSSPNISSFSQLMIDRGAALPVDLLQFAAVLVEKKTVEVSWRTTNEIENDHFVVQWSTDGRNFVDLEKVESLSSSPAELLNYSILHHDPQRGSNFYRLKQVDTDETFSYSSIRHIVIEALPSDYVVFPNPIEGNQQLNIKASNEDTYHFSLWSAKGNRLLYKKLSGDAYVDINHLSSGVYFYKIESQNKLYHGRLVVE